MKTFVKKDYLFFGLVLAFVLYSIFWFSHYSGSVIQSDGEYYYQYFSRTFITHDFKNSALIKYPIGTTLLQLPFLLIGKLVSYLMGMDYENGLNVIFQGTVFVSAVFYTICGFIFVYMILIKRFSRKAAVMTCGCLLWGTMILVYSAEMASFSHAYGFFLCALFLYYVEVYEKGYDAGIRKKKIISDIVLGAILGLIVLVRNTNIIIGFAYLLYNVTSPCSLRTRLNRVFSWKILIQILTFLFVYAVQIICWKIQTGHYIFFSYGDESFLYAANPQILKVLFSDAKGLFIYSPVLIIGLLGMIFELKQNPEFGISQWIIFVLQVYIISAWWCWWLGCAYSERMFCDFLSIFAIPMAAIFDGVDNNVNVNQSKNAGTVLPRMIKHGIYLFAVAFVVLNFVWIDGCRNGVISNNLGTWAMLQNQLIRFFLR